MQLIGMLDSPYVRRVAISLRLLGVPFEHRSLSVFSTFEQFSQINPVVKAPTLVTEDGVVLMDSTLILQWVEPLASRRLTPVDTAERLRDLRVTGLALAVCEKVVQIVYEQQLRPSEKQHQPWLDRVDRQLHAAYEALEAEVLSAGLVADVALLTHGSIAAAVAWSFTQLVLPGRLVPTASRSLVRFAEAAEELDVFRACPQVSVAN